MGNHQTREVEHVRALQRGFGESTHSGAAVVQRHANQLLQFRASLGAGAPWVADGLRAGFQDLFIVVVKPHAEVVHVVAYLALHHAGLASQADLSVESGAVVGVHGVS